MSPGPGSWVQAGPSNSASNLGQVSDQPLTFTDVAAVTVSNSDIALVAADAAGIARTVIISMKPNVDTGIHLSFGGTAATTDLFLPPGIYSFVTQQAVSAIRAGAADVIVYLATAKV